MANEHYTEPVVGREKIKRKMEDLKLNDCRAKIKQIDCLETLAGGLVIQVIGELSNNGKPMRRFLQTFVLAPSPDESRQEGDSQHGRSGVQSDRRGAQANENSSSSHNQKFFVLNSIFRYQDDGPDSEFEDDASIRASDTTNGSIDTNKVDPAPKQIPSNVNVGNSNGSPSDYSLNRRQPTEAVKRNVEDVESLANVLEESVKLNKQAVPEHELEREVSNVKVVSNGTGIHDKKNEISEKSTENGKTADHSLGTTSINSASNATDQHAPVAAMSRPQPSNEPKTWANMVRNAHPPSASININKTSVVATELQQHNVIQPATIVSQQQQPQQQQQNQQQQQQQQLQQPQQLQQQQQQPQQLQQPQQNLQNNNRRRHMVRKPSNKTTGRSIKSRENRPRPPLGKPAA